MRWLTQCDVGPYHIFLRVFGSRGKPSYHVWWRGGACGKSWYGQYVEGWAVVVVWWCAEGAVNRRQWLGCLPTGTSKREGCVCCTRAVCDCVATAGAWVRGTGTQRLLIRLSWSAQ